MGKERQHHRLGKKEIATAGLVAAAAVGISLMRQAEKPKARVVNEKATSPIEEFQPHYLTVPVEIDAFPKLLYQVKEGDTLYDLAEGWGVSVEQIVTVNGIRDPDLIHVGQLLRMLPPTHFDNIVIKPVGYIEPSDDRSQFVINGFNYYIQRQADLSFEKTYFYPGELDSAPKSQEGLAHLYGLNADAESLNEVTSSGQRFNPKKLICASWFYPIGSIVRVFYNGRSVECLVNDRGPNRLYRYEGGETKNVIIDLSVATARAIEPNAGVRPGQIGEMSVSVDLVSLPENWKEISGQLPVSLR